MSTEMAREDVERLVRIETKLDEFLRRSIEDRAAFEAEMAQVKQDTEKDLGEINRKMDETEKRVNSLENWRYAVAAALMMSSAGAIGAAISIVPK